MHGMMRYAVAMAVALGLMVVGALAQPATTRPSKDHKERPYQDSRFLEEAAQGGLFEVAAGRVAVQRGQTADVRDFGQRMVDDHTRLNEQITQLAKAKGVEPPTELDKKHRKELDRLEKSSDREFNQRYMRLMVKDHQKDVKEFRRAVQQTQDADIRRVASDAIPVLEQHLSMAEQIVGQQGGGPPTSTQPSR